MTNKTPLSILYEYSNQVYKMNPRFEILEKENPKDPFLAICYINEKVCGRGNGNSKKAAKNTAGKLFKMFSFVISIQTTELFKPKRHFACSFPNSKANRQIVKKTTKKCIRLVNATLNVSNRAVNC